MPPLPFPSCFASSGQCRFRVWDGDRGGSCGAGAGGIEETFKASFLLTWASSSSAKLPSTCWRPCPGPGPKLTAGRGDLTLQSLPWFGSGWKHQGTPPMLESKQHPRSKHCSLVMPGKPQFFLLWGVSLEHRQGAVDRGSQRGQPCPVCQMLVPTCPGGA